jgi:hypothetical protein
MMRPSRRGLFVVAAMIAVAAVRCAAATPPAKLSQQRAHYQPTAKFGQNCAMCQLFRPPGSCQIVAGAISPHGWCQFFSLPD